MKILGILLVVLSLFKLSCLKYVDKENILAIFSQVPMDIDSCYKTTMGIVLLDLIIGIICGVFIVFI